MSSRQVVLASREEVRYLIEDVVRVIRNHSPEQHLQIYLFGSWAEGTALSTSDLDIGLDLGHPVKPTAFQGIVEGVAELPTLRKVDILDLQLVGPDFRERVRNQGELIHG